MSGAHRRPPQWKWWAAGTAVTGIAIAGSTWLLGALDPPSPVPSDPSASAHVLRLPGREPEPTTPPSTPVATPAPSTPAETSVSTGEAEASVPVSDGERSPAPSPVEADAAPAPRPAPAPLPAPPPAAPAESGVVREVVNLTNAFRAEVGCAPLAVSDDLTGQAQAHSQVQAEQRYMHHSGGAAGWPSWGENVAQGYPDAQSVVEAWIASPGHRANMANCAFTYIGVGVAEAADGPYWTQTFGAR